MQQMKENDIKIINSHELKNFIHKSNSIAFDVNGQVQKSFNYVLINLLVIVTTYYLWDQKRLIIMVLYREFF